MSVELLAPVGNYEAFVGAINEGADAIYIGGNKFSARANCENFSDEKFQEMIDYAHEYGVKVYVAFNTLIKQSELEEAFDYGIKLYNMGIDALIIQDAGLIYMFTKFKECDVHASTQLSIHNLGGAEYYQESGVTRVVVARELSIEDIRIISEKVETEGFVHGAICVSYSGQCTMSGLIAERSGNRGRCAQPCRMEYSLINKDNKEFKTGFLMSPKDLMTINILPKLLKETKIKSLKIEGRMKRGEYVVNTVKNYRDIIDKIENNIPITKDDFKSKEDDLLKIFNREGFTNGYMLGYEGQKFLSVNNPKNQGVYLGEVLNDGSILLKTNISLGDGVSFKDNGFIVTKILNGKDKISTASEGMKVKLFPTRFSKGDKLYKTNDNKFERELRKSFEKEYTRTSYINGKFEFIPNKPMKLELFSDKYNTSIKVFGEVVEIPQKNPVSKERIIEQLCKGRVGSFSIKNIDVVYEEGYINISKLNELRREALGKFREKVIESFHKNLSYSFKNDVEKIKSERVIKDDKYFVYVSTDAQFDAVYEKGFRNIIFSPFMYNRKIDFDKILSYEDLNLYIKFPTIIKEYEFEKIFKVFERFRNRVKGILTSNAGVIREFKDSNFEIIGDYRLNIFNSKSTEFYKEVDKFMISIELCDKEIRELSENTNKDLCMFVYGKPDVMVSEYCPIGTFVGGRSLNKECLRPCTKNDFYLKDRVGNKLLLTTAINCKISTYKEEPINLINEINDIKKSNINIFRLDFIDETYEQTRKILDHLINNKPFKNTFKGNYYKPVD